MNAFHSLASIGGFLERREIKERPITIDNEGIFTANPAPKAPLTLTRLLLSKGPLKEVDIIRDMFYLTLISGSMALITSIMFQLDTLAVIVLLSVGVGATLLISFILPKECQEIVWMLAFVWVSSIFGFWIIDILLIETPLPLLFIPALLIQALKITVAGLLVLAWLVIWNRLVKMIFKRNLAMTLTTFAT